MGRPTISNADIEYVSRILKIKWGDVCYTKDTLKNAMLEEMEHEDVSNDDLIITAKIAVAHLNEDPKYYEKLNVSMSTFGNDILFCISTFDVILIIIAILVFAFALKLSWKYSVAAGVAIGIGYKFIDLKGSD